MRLPMATNVRFVVCCVAWFILLTFYTHRSNVSVAILAMAPSSSSYGFTSYSSCLPISNVSTKSEDEYPFRWTHKEQGYILSAFFIGYLTSNFLGSLVTSVLGLRAVMITCLIGSTITTFSMAFLAHVNVWAFITGRTLCGFFSGPLYPLMHELLGKYLPSHERTLLSVLTHTGNTVGLVFNFGIGGYIVENYSDGWKYLFILDGGLGVIGLFLWCIFVYSSPEEHPLMSKEEVNIIVNGSYSSDHHYERERLCHIPFKRMFSSIQLYIICFAQFGNSLMLYAQLTGHPKYLNSVFGISKSLASYLSIIPFICYFTSQIMYSFIHYHFESRRFLKTSSLRRLSSALAFLGSTIPLSIVGFLPCEYFWTTIMMVALSMTLLAPNQAGYFTAMIDLSPKRAGIVMGIANTFGSLSGVIQPQLTSYFLAMGNIKDGYKYAFLVTSIIALTSGLPFILAGSSEDQEWDEPRPKHKRKAIKTLEPYIPLPDGDDI